MVKLVKDSEVVEQAAPEREYPQWPYFGTDDPFVGSPYPGILPEDVEDYERHLENGGELCDFIPRSQSTSNSSTIMTKWMSWN